MKLILAIALTVSVSMTAGPQRNGFNVRYLGGIDQMKGDKEDWNNSLTVLSEEMCSLTYEGRLQGKDLKNVFKNFAFTFDNDLNKATYGAKAGAVLSGPEAMKVPRVPIEVMAFSETVARYFLP